VSRIEIPQRSSLLSYEVRFEDLLNEFLFRLKIQWKRRFLVTNRCRSSADEVIALAR